MSDVQAILNVNQVATRETRRGLDNIFAPRSMAVIGATEAAGRFARTVMSNRLRSLFGGPVDPVNPKRRSVLGVPSCSSISASPGKVDVAVIVTPEPTAPGVIDQCIGAKVGGAIIISAG